MKSVAEFFRNNQLMNTKNLILTIIVLAVLLIASLAYNYKQWRDLEETSTHIKIEYKEKEVIKEVHDTIPAPSDEQQIGQAVIPIPSHGGNGGNNGITESRDSTQGTPTSNITLPIIQRTYTNDTLYTAYVSGVKYADYPKLDSINIKQKTVYQQTTITKEIQRRQKKFGIGIIGGYGYGFNSRQVEPYIGIGLSWHILEF